MYWRIQTVTPEQMMRQYGVHIALVVAILLNVLQFFTRPNTRALDTSRKQDFAEFARKVTRELLDSSYITFEQSTMALMQRDLATNVKTQLMQTDKLPKSADDMKATIKTLTDQRQVSACRIAKANGGGRR